MERVREKARISERLYNILQGRLTPDNYEEFYKVNKGKNDEKEKRAGNEGKGKPEEVHSGGNDKDIEEKKEERDSLENEEEVCVVKIVAKNAKGNQMNSSSYYLSKKDVQRPSNPKESPLRKKWKSRNRNEGVSVK